MRFMQDYPVIVVMIVAVLAVLFITFILILADVVLEMYEDDLDSALDDEPVVR